jgi:hypothetical protein
VAVNFADERVADVVSTDGWKLEISTDRGREGRPWTGSLEASEAVILSRA